MLRLERVTASQKEMAVNASIKMDAHGLGDSAVGSATNSEMVDLEDQRKLSVFGREKNVQVDWNDLTG